MPNLIPKALQRDLERQDAEREKRRASGFYTEEAFRSRMAKSLEADLKLALSGHCAETRVDENGVEWVTKPIAQVVKEKAPVVFYRNRISTWFAQQGRKVVKWTRFVLSKFRKPKSNA
jgi:hypothetical protein